MKTLLTICLMLLLTTFSSAYAGDCIKDLDVPDCRIKAEQGNANAQYIDKLTANTLILRRTVNPSGVAGIN